MALHATSGMLGGGGTGLDPNAWGPIPVHRGQPRLCGP